MNATRPEAESEYSRASRGSGGDLPGSDGPRGRSPAPASRAVTSAVLLSGILGAALLLAAEFTALFTVHSSASPVAIKTVTTASHDSYALVPIAVLAALLTLEACRTRGRLALVAIAVLGLVALGIAVAHDLPDAHASGVIGNSPTTLRQANSTPALGFYLETLGAIVLLITSATGLLLLPRPGSEPRRRRPERTGSPDHAAIRDDG